MSAAGKKQKPVFYLIYNSTEVSPFSDEMLKDLLDQSLEFNNKNNITGMLLYVKGQKFTKTNGRFMQLLEGEERVIRKLYQRIQDDDRHKSVVLMQEGKYAERLFNEWNMGFEQLDDRVYEAAAGHFNLSEIFMQCEPLPSDSPLAFLQTFTLKAIQG